MRLKRAVCVLLCALFAAMLMPAADAGQLPLDTPGCGEVITKSFRLAQDVSCGLLNAWFADKDGLIIDLNGHSLTGDGGANDVGILLTGGRDITIKNGVIRHFGVAIQTDAPAKKWVISRVVAVDSTTAGFIAGNVGLIKKSTAVGGLDGIISLAGRVTMTGNRVANNTRYGIHLVTDKNVVKQNLVVGNDDFGIYVPQDENTVSGNSVVANGHAGGGDPGILVLGDNNTINSNVIFGNADDGYRDSGSANSASKNTAHGNGFLNDASNGVGTGIDATAATDPEGTDNRSLGNDASTQCVPASMCSPLKTDEDLQVLTPGCGDTVSQSFRLGANMSCTGDAMIIGADGITIDLNGKTISGDGGNNDTGIDNGPNGRDDVTLRNGMIRGFDNGVQVTGERFRIRDVVAVLNVFGINVGGSDALVERTTAVANSGAGILVAGSTPTVRGTRLARNGDGISINDGAADVVVSGNLLGQNGGGIYVADDNALVVGNRVLASGIVSAGSGITADPSTIANTFKQNLLIGNDGDGYFDAGGGNAAIANTAIGNGFDDGLSDADGTGIDGGTFPTGHDNVSFANDAIDQCDPDFLCE